MRGQGFTLLEMLVVMAILGILLAIGAPNLLGFINNSRANAAAADLAAVLRQAGGRALSLSERITVSLTDSNTAVTWKNVAGTQSGKRILPYNAAVTSVTPGNIAFSGRGLPVEQYRLTLKTGNATRTVVVLVTGKVVIP